MASISVIVVCHNHHPFLAEAFCSLEQQSRPPDEIIVMDDASTDDTWSAIQEFVEGRPKARAIRHDRIAGPAVTFNEGISASTGDLIVILSGDDRLSHRYLELMERPLTANEWGFAYANSHRFGTDSRVLRFPAFRPSRLARFNYVSASAMFRREVFEAIGGWDPRFDAVGYDDWDFWLRAVKAGFNGVHVDGCYLEWRQHPRNRTTKQTKLDVLRARVLIAKKHPWSVRIWMMVGLVERASIAPFRFARYRADHE